MKALVEIQRKSNDQLNNRLNEIRVSLHRIQGYNKGACSEPNEMKPVKKMAAKEGLSSNVMLQHKLRIEQARILTLLNERRLKIR